MSSPVKVAVLVGSLRKASFNRKLARALIGMAPATLSLEIVEIGELPLYDQDLEATPPVAWTAFREQASACAAFLFVTPEYNRSVPGALKNAIDVGSRPYGKSVWGGKPGADRDVLTNESTRGFLDKYLQAFHTWITRNAA